MDRNFDRQENRKMEYWDIYDKNKQKTGRKMKRNDWHMAPGDYHLTVLGAVQRPDGSYLITKRREDKEWAPGSWEIPGGGVTAGEESAEAVAREIREETGIDVSDAEGGLVFTYERVNPEEQNNYFVDVYRFVLDFDESDVRVQDSEVAGFKFADAEEIKKLGEEGKFLHYSSIKQIF
ncbi:MAG: NUDIX hydrolase [Anaerovoracaceae bacterium]|nr:NUDIX hydrolase [Anaerovoracaceae bacterium]